MSRRSTSTSPLTPAYVGFNLTFNTLARGIDRGGVRPVTGVAAGPDRTVETVTRFFDRMRVFDWDAMAACLATNVTCVGPYRDVKQGRTDYRDFLAETIEAISGYHQDIQRIWSDGDHAVAQLSETMDVDGRPRRTDQAIVLDLGPDGLINRVEVYLQRADFVEIRLNIVVSRAGCAVHVLERLEAHGRRPASASETLNDGGHEPQLTGSQAVPMAARRGRFVGPLRAPGGCRSGHRLGKDRNRDPGDVGCAATRSLRPRARSLTCADGAMAHCVAPATLPGVRIGRLGDAGATATCDVLVATRHSAAAYKPIPPDGSGGLLIADECHGLGGKTLRRALLHEYEERLGLTANAGAQRRRGHRSAPAVLRRYLLPVRIRAGDRGTARCPPACRTRGRAALGRKNVRSTSPSSTGS